MVGMPVIRPYRKEDFDAVYDICIRTGYLGSDARPHYEDPTILPEIFAAPYVILEPEVCFVVADGDDAVGYIVATPDTPAFVRRFREQWLPLVADRYPAFDGEPSNLDELMRKLLHWPERMLISEMAPYPAHLHIDLLPAYQGQGFGGRLIRTLRDKLAEIGVPGLHLTMARDNDNAYKFYHRIGFEQIAVAGESPASATFAMRTGA
jgi:ribosomal protein S18 acetylase RimI-like enzyme